MSIINAIERAYSVMRDRNWERIYWAIDLHGVCLQSSYSPGDYMLCNHDVVEGLKRIAEQPESKLILWSSCHPGEYKAIIEYFYLHGVRIDYFNENPEEENTTTGNFEKKFYFSVLLDDKAGFNPDEDWEKIVNFFDSGRHIEILKGDN